jgi:hypothetical protein
MKTKNKKSLLTMLFVVVSLFAILLVLINITEYFSTSEDGLMKLSTPVVSQDQDWSWFVASNPNLNFAPAVHFQKPSFNECVEFVNKNYDNPDERNTKLIECLQNVSGAVRRRNMSITSPGTGEYFSI